ncbi:DUF4352 domain-containing protein [Methanolobus sp. WCC4]|uniref:DUF4352 domain-containing protein n=1 Tax=Methanolobus sp. WCC4 TaxID=3125784 RepID=UPI0030F82B78
MMAEAYAQDIIDRTCFWDWKYEFSEQVGNYTAPEGYNFVVCTIHLQNNEFGPIFTEPGNWKLTAGGVSHNHDIATYSDEISYHSMHDWPGQVLDTWYEEEIDGWTGEEVDDWTQEKLDEYIDNWSEGGEDYWDGEEMETQIVYLVQTNRSIQELNCAVDYPYYLSRDWHYHSYLDPSAFTLNFDWKYELTDRVGNDLAPYGYDFVVCDLYFQNNDNEAISTDPDNWELVAGGVSHEHDMATYSNEISCNIIDVENGMEAETQIVYLIQEDITIEGISCTADNIPPIHSTWYYSEGNSRSTWWDWMPALSKQIGNNTAPDGYNFVVCNIFLNNREVRSISTDPNNWKLIASGVSYDHDMVTYSDEISSNSIDVEPGMQTETQIVYLIPENNTIESLVYDAYNPPIMTNSWYYRPIDY